MGERIQIPQKRAVIGPPAKLHLMALVALESISVKIVCNFRGIAMGPYEGWRRGGGGGGGLCLPWISVCMRMCPMNFSVCLSVCLSI